jgi:hypothetical protein
MGFNPFKVKVLQLLFAAARIAAISKGTEAVGKL